MPQPIASRNSGPSELKCVSTQAPRVEISSGAALKEVPIPNQTVELSITKTSNVMTMEKDFEDFVRQKKSMLTSNLQCETVELFPLKELFFSDSSHQQASMISFLTGTDNSPTQMEKLVAETRKVLLTSNSFSNETSHRNCKEVTDFHAPEANLNTSELLPSEATFFPVSKPVYQSQHLAKDKKMNSDGSGNEYFGSIVQSGAPDICHNEVGRSLVNPNIMEGGETSESHQNLSIGTTPSIVDPCPPCHNDTNSNSIFADEETTDCPEARYSPTSTYVGTFHGDSSTWGSEVKPVEIPPEVFHSRDRKLLNPKTNVKLS